MDVTENRQSLFNPDSEPVHVALVPLDCSLYLLCINSEFIHFRLERARTDVRQSCDTDEQVVTVDAVAAATERNKRESRHMCRSIARKQCPVGDKSARLRHVLFFFQGTVICYDCVACLPTSSSLCNVTAGTASKVGTLFVNPSLGQTNFERSTRGEKLKTTPVASQNSKQLEIQFVFR